MLSPPIRVCTLGVALLSATATEASSCIRGASNISGFCARTNLIYEILILRELAQLEVANYNFSVACFELITEFLDCVLVDECASCLALCVNGVGNVIGVLASVVASSVDVAVDSAAAIFHRIAEVGDTLTSCVEAITQTVGDTTKLSVDVLSVEALEQVGASERALYGSIVGATISKQSTITEDCEPYQINKPLCYEIADSAISLYIAIKSRLYLLLKEKSCTSD